MDNASARVLLILVDQPTQRALFNQHLASTPHHVVYATDGEDAYDRYSEVKPHLVISHLHASRIDGGLLCQFVRQRLGGSHVPYVLVGDQASASEGERRATEVDADFFLTLPLTDEDFAESIEPLLYNGRTKTDIKARSDVLDADEVTANIVLERPTRVLNETVPPPAAVTSSQSSASVGALPTESIDIDTVVSFQNPFFGISDAEIDAVVLDRDEPITHVEAPELSSITASNTPTIDQMSMPDRLAEPRIATNPGPVSPRKPNTSSRLIAEVPRERTP
ncbi:MAG: hypothetical protein AAF449_24625, partial [Myxococcota bacterium]